MSSTTSKFTIILEPDEDGGYSVHCPALPGWPGCVSQGEGRDDALENIKESISLVLEVLEEDKSLAVPAAEATHWLPIETPEVVAAEIREVLKARREDGLPLTIETAQVEVTSPVSA